MKRMWGTTAAICLWLAIVAIGAPGAARSDESAADLWAPGTNWLTVRAGYARSLVSTSGEGGAGVGFAFSHMVTPIEIYKWTIGRKFSIDGSIHYDLLSHFGTAAEIEVPATLALVRHFDWGSPMHPYLGIGAGPYYRKTYRTGADTRSVEIGKYVTFGGNVPIGERQLLGVDARLARVDASYVPPNPVFGPGSATLQSGTDPPVYEKHTGTRWGVKVGYSLAY